MKTNSTRLVPLMGIALVGLIVLLPAANLAGQQVSTAIGQVDMQARQYAPPVERLSDLPFTDHALTSHSKQQWNAVTITSWIDSGKCRPTHYICPDDTELYVCDLKDRLSIGVVIGATARRVITGFAANREYWHRDSCDVDF